jgi:hypothetical protein
MELEQTNKEEFNGWTNRETWALNLWLTNDEGTYNEVVRILKEAHKTDLKQGTKTIYKQDALKDFVEKLNEIKQGSRNLSLMFDNVGSLWRVNWGEIVTAFNEDL